jgi:hypothetical protein
MKQKINEWEERLQLAAHPKGYPLLKWLAKFGTNIRIPGIGLVVSDAALMRDVLTDPAFSKTGKGGPAGCGLRSLDPRHSSTWMAKRT